ncbi:MAG TPA: hypothetical protein VK559_03655 [Ferruginibacter sp.]|nr:hypothetical protein [Ferruginibacter sp.]
MGEGNYTSEIVTYVCKGDTLTKEFKDTYGPRMSSGLPITISIEAVNRQNQPIEWSSISIVLK